jgi:hypothetical protein
MGALLVVTALVLSGLATLWLSARRSVTICMLEIRDGVVEVTHGGLAPRVLADVRDIARRPVVERASLRVLRGRNYATVETSGKLTGNQAQQLRNVIGSVPLAMLTPGRRKT